MSKSHPFSRQDKLPVVGEDQQHVFKGGGEMGAFMRSYDWDTHPLGNPAGWPQSLKSNIRLMLNSGFPMFIWWSRELYAFHNDAYLPALGDKHPYALGMSAKVVWAEIWEQLKDIVENILNGGEYFYTEELMLMLERKGFPEETYWTFSYSAAYDDAGEVAGIFCSCTEVTGSVLNQRRLKTLKNVSEAFTQSQSLEQACQATCNTLIENRKDIPFTLIYLLNSTGTMAELKGAAGYYLPESAPAVVDLVQADTTDGRILKAVYRSGQPEEFSVAEINTITSPKKGVVVPIFKPGHSDVIGYFVAGLSDALEYNTNYQNFHTLLASQIATSIISVQGREEISRQKEFLHDLFQQAPVGITIMNGPDYVVELANSSMCELWGRKPEEVLGRPVLEAIPGIEEQGIKALLDNVLYTGQPYVNHEMPLELLRNGEREVVYFDFVYHPMRNSIGFVTGIIAVAIGINEQVEARQKIEAINRELLATNADLDNFVYSASHDLKAPISNIEGLVHALLDHLPAETLASESVQHLNHHIHSSIGRFKRAVNDLSQVARIQREAGEDVGHINLAEVVAEVSLDFESLIRATGARIETNFDPEVTLKFSAKNMRSIVYNLLSNSLKYRSPDRAPQICISTHNTPEHFLLSVADNGLGIDLSKKNKIFSMFKRLHDHVEGSGVGLYIVKRIVENAGGNIEVESEEGKGTTFHVFLPR